MKRVILKYLKEDIRKKILIITGPRQCGKTTISKMVSDDFDYLNYDEIGHRLLFKDKSWDRKKNYLIFDEIHKMKNWKRWLKGIYDTEGIPPGLIVTGSARLDIYKKMGDSLAGRFFQYRLHPFDIKELATVDKRTSSDVVLEKIMEVGGFPEPYIQEKKRFYNKWKKTHLDIILRQDMIDLESVRHISAIETLIEMLKYRVGSSVSYQSLAEDLQYSDKTIKRWIGLLESMYVIFKLTPYHKNIARSNLKAPKYYFYDTAQVKGDQGQKLENLVACSLLKECHFQQDCLGEDLQLNYLSKKGGKEIDFLLTKDESPITMIEVKWKESNPSKNFDLFSKDLQNISKIQLVKELKREKTYPNGVEIRKVANWIKNL